MACLKLVLEKSWNFLTKKVYEPLSSVSPNVLKFYQQLTGEERKIPFIFDDFHF